MGQYRIKKTEECYAGLAIPREVMNDLETETTSRNITQNIEFRNHVLFKLNEDFWDFHECYSTLTWKEINLSSDLYL